MDTAKVKHMGLIIWLLLVPCIFLFPFILNPSKITSLNNDIQFWIPIYNEFKKSIVQSSTIVLWQNKTLLGFPLLGDPQSIVTYPFTYLVTLVSLPTFFVLYLLFHLTVSSIAVYFVSNKVIKLPTISALLVSFLYTFSPKMLSHIGEGHINLVAAYSLFPALILSIYVLLNKPNIKKSLLVGLLFSALFITYITVFYYSLLAAILLLVVLLINKKLHLNNKTITYLALAFIFGVGFQLPQILAEIELWPQLSRYLLTYQDIGGPSYAWRQFLSYIFNPFSVNNYPVEYVLYLGLIAVALAAIGFLNIKSAKYKTLLAFFITLIFFYNFGTKTIIYELAYKFIPGVNLFRVPTRSYYLISLSVSLLAGMGIKYVKYKYGKTIAIALVLICLFEYFLIGQKILNSKTIINYEKQNPLFEEISKDYDSFYRVYCTTGCIPYKFIEGKKIGSAVGYNPVQLANVFHYHQQMGGYQFGSYAPFLPPYQTYVDKPQPKAQELALVRVKYVISEHPLSDPNLELATTHASKFLYKNNIVLPRAWIKTSTDIYPLTIINDIPGVMEVYAPEKGEIIVPEVFTKGWRAYDSNNSKVAIKEYEGIIISTNDEQEGNIIFKYEPLGYPISLVVPLLTYTFLIVLLVLEFFNKQFKY